MARPDSRKGAFADELRVGFRCAQTGLQTCKIVAVRWLGLPIIVNLKDNLRTVIPQLISIAGPLASFHGFLHWAASNKIQLNYSEILIIKHPNNFLGIKSAAAHLHQ